MAKRPPSTIKQVEARQRRRSKRARAADSAGTSRSVFGRLNRDKLGRWMKNPRRHDVAGVDTKGKGKAPRTVSLRQLVKRKRKSKR